MGLFLSRQFMPVHISEFTLPTDDGAPGAFAYRKVAASESVSQARDHEEDEEAARFAEAIKSECSCTWKDVRNFASFVACVLLSVSLLMVVGKFIHDGTDIHESRTAEGVRHSGSAVRAAHLVVHPEIQGAVALASTLAVKKIALVMFYTPWCQHSHALLSEWAAARHNIMHSGLAPGHADALMVKVDCSSFADLCEFVGIKGYPTVLVYTDETGYLSKYVGARTRLGFQAFIADNVPKANARANVAGYDESYDEPCQEEAGRVASSPPEKARPPRGRLAGRG
ncbi:hypothetical protein EMIHUDRAFT_198780 [Emiliania huxleyi CCMP1516]|uniref:Thioredoxin domain-containing protein n=2 Tax=Emiliania huxleyi TaxID=2903 RepID=A0A0D3I7V3_EMIH1|nr:hypothetical protein EMIHUDRAFT_198780 [Emiliania huxleyi CCMP1516]EOD07338.1 hypothetical protein EMIHUDRAFT_198780 [Emiliania huxleyi CCMP1516]|eukprot:XP_005759767.1 hypothetical protein EMIHUDRAFT_198780 [Emiliania huxleyi CCMP1516]